MCSSDLRSDHHADEFDEAVAERFHHLAGGGKEGSERDAGDDAGDHAEVQAVIEAGVCGHGLNHRSELRLLQRHIYVVPREGKSGTRI